MGNPADCTPDGENDREHVGGNSHCLEYYAGVEIDVWIELFSDEIFIVQGDSFQFNGDFEQGIIFVTQFFQNFVAGLAHDRGPGVMIFVDSMAESHETKRNSTAV